MILKLVHLWGGLFDNISKINLLLNPFENMTNEGGTITDNIPLGPMRVCAKPPYKDKEEVPFDAQILVTLG